MGRFEKEYLPSDNKIWITGGAGGDLSVRKGILKIRILTKL